MTSGCVASLAGERDVREIELLGGSLTCTEEGLDGVRGQRQAPPSIAGRLEVE